MIARASSIVLGIALVACTKVYADPVTDTDVLTAMSICPDIQPQGDTDCSERINPNNNTSLARLCEYGSNADLGCNDRLSCTIAFSATWSPSLSLGCALNHCPRAHADIVDGAPCDAPVAPPETTVHEYVCGYAEGTCGCIASPTGFAWKCVPPPPAPCPPKRPNLGHYCDQDDLACDYDACSFEHSANVVCTGNRWQVADVACD